MPNETLYDSVFLAWTEQQAEALRRAARERANTPLAARPALEAFIRKGAFTETEVLNAGVFPEPASSALNGNSH